MDRVDYLHPTPTKKAIPYGYCFQFYTQFILKNFKKINNCNIVFGFGTYMINIANSFDIFRYMRDRSCYKIYQ